MGLFGNSKAKKEAAFMAPQWLKIVNDCAVLVNSTVNPEVFFMRYDLMLEHLTNLADAEKYVKFSGKRPSAQLRELIDSRERETDTFIDRAMEAALKKSATLKTTNGQAGLRNRFFEKMDAHAGSMTAQNLNHLEKLRQVRQRIT